MFTIIQTIKNNLYAENRKKQLEESIKSVQLKIEELKFKIDCIKTNKNKLFQLNSPKNKFSLSNNARNNIEEGEVFG